MYITVCTTLIFNKDSYVSHIVIQSFTLVFIPKYISYLKLNDECINNTIINYSIVFIKV